MKFQNKILIFGLILIIMPITTKVNSLDIPACSKECESNKQMLLNGQVRAFGYDRLIGHYDPTKADLDTWVAVIARAKDFVKKADNKILFNKFNEIERICSDVISKLQSIQVVANSNLDVNDKIKSIGILVNKFLPISKNLDAIKVAIDKEKNYNPLKRSSFNDAKAIILVFGILLIALLKVFLIFTINIKHRRNNL